MRCARLAWLRVAGRCAVAPDPARIGLANADAFCFRSAMLPDWIRTDKGFWVHPDQASYTVAFVAGLCWATQARCMACGRSKTWSVAELTQVFPADATMAAIALRLRCSACRSDQGRVGFRNDHGAYRERNMEAYARRFGEEASARPKRSFD